MSTIISAKDDTDAPTVLVGSTDPESKATTEASSADGGSANPEELSSQIDSALLAAMRDPRERLALLRLEQVLCDLMRSETDGWIEVGGPFNSSVLWPSETSARCGAAYPAGLRQTTFQRLILHRLADRFGIIREQGSLLQTTFGDGNMMAMGSGAIRLIKLPQSKIPSCLLQDLDASVYEQGGDTATLPPAAEGVGSPTRPSQTNKSQKPRKMKIMKRQGSNQSQSSNYKGGGKSNGSSHSGRLSLSDKEKAYAEARARIFQDQQEGATRSAQLQLEENNSTGELTSGVQNLSVSGESTGAPGNNINNNSNSASRGIPYHRSSSLRSSTGSLSSAASNHSGCALQRSDSNTAAAEGRKAVYRNYAEEAADPDFQRGVLRTAVAAATATAHAAYGGTNPAWQQSMTGAYPPMQSESSAQHSYTAAVPSYAPPTTSNNGSWPSLGAPPTAASTTGTASSSRQQQEQQQQQSFASAVANGSSKSSSSSRGGGKSLTATAPAWTPRSSSAS